jgi:hypothetical protein
VTSSEPQPEESGVKPPTTQEIPVVQPATGATATQQLPPHPGASTPAPVQPVDAVVPTGPVDFVPGLPGVGTPPPPPPVRPAPVADEPAPPAAGASEATGGRSWPATLESEVASAKPRRKRRARSSGVHTPGGGPLRDRSTVLGIALTVLSLVLLELGLTMRGEVAESYWESIPLWSAFATVCALLGLGAFVAFAAARNRLRPDGLWRIAAAGLVGLAVFWLLVVLPVVATDRGFVLTAALGALGGALWVGPRGKD